MSKTKVLLIINQFFKGGAECALLNLLKNLHPEKYDIDFIIYDHLRLKGTVNLIDEIPDWIHVFNAAEEEYRVAFLKKGLHKLWRKISDGEQLYRRNVYKYVNGRRYDVAVSFGEWFSCSLVALYVTARRKYIWIHADMDKATYLYPDILLLWQHFDNFLFVSERSFRAAVERYPFLKDRGLVLHNIVDADSIIRKSEATCQLPALNEKLPVLVTVANIRPEKNHIRQIAVMKELFDRGLRFYWVNVGNLANVEHVRCVKNALEQAGLQGYFLLTGVMENPYPIMRQADAVCVLSDYESWSMVITEALTLGIPVIATKTSGAVEQLTDNETGLLCDFTLNSIADQIQRFLKDPELHAHMCTQIKKQRDCHDDLNQIESLLSNKRKKILYVFDDINYTSGARNSALLQMKYLAQRADVEAFSAEPCTDKNLTAQWRIWDLSDNQEFRCLSVPFKQVIMGSYSIRSKLIRLVYAFLARISLDNMLFEHLLKSEVSVQMNGYDAVCVVSEASKLRTCVAALEGPKKVQWIHTDYKVWRNLTGWTRAITSHDNVLYEQYDTIVCLSERLKSHFAECHPHLIGKVAVIPNFVDANRIRRLAEEPCAYQPQNDRLNLVSVGRMEPEKRYDRLLEIAVEVKKRRSFHWYFVGDGVLLNEMKTYCTRLGLDDCISFTGILENPYPLMKRCDLFVLFSEYEGTPVTIDEAKTLGLTILANDVGGVADQLVGTESTFLITGKESAVETICQMDVKDRRNAREAAPLADASKNNRIAETQLFDRIIKEI